MGHRLLILHVVCFVPERDEQVEVCKTKNEMGFDLSMAICEISCVNQN